MKIKAKVSLVVALAGFSVTAISQAAAKGDTSYNYPVKANAAYTYDVSNNCPTKGIIPDYLTADDVGSGAATYATCTENWDKTIPTQILAFNKAIVDPSSTGAATTGVNQLYIYGADMEVYYYKDNPKPNPNDLSGANASLTTPSNPHFDNYSGENNLDNYLTQLNADSANKVKNIDVIIDGRNNNLGVYAQFLNSFQTDLGTNELPMDSWTQAFATQQAEQVLINGYTHYAKDDPSNNQTFDGICKTLAAKQAKFPNIQLGGMQFDLEPFHMPDNTTGKLVCDGTSNAPKDCGQYYFYRAVKNIFEGKDSAVTTNYCLQSGLKPHFSAFVLTGSFLNSQGNVSPEAQDLFGNDSKDSYAAISLYDLGAAGSSHLVAPANRFTVCASKTGTDDSCLFPDIVSSGDTTSYTDYNTARAGFIASTPAYYSSMVSAEINNLQKLEAAKIHYQLGVPAAASAHEFDGFKIQAPDSSTTTYYTKSSTTDSSGETAYKPQMASGDAFYDPSAAASDDSTQAAYMQAVLDQITAYEIKEKTPYYMGITLWSFQAKDGNHWAPRNVVSAQTDPVLGSVIPNEYTMGSDYDGLLNPAAYMRLYTPNSVCAGDGCDPDEANVMSVMQAAAKNPAFNIFQFASAIPVIQWSADSVITPANYNADGTFQVTIKPATLSPNPEKLQVGYSASVFNDKRVKIDHCPVAENTTTGDYVATCQVDSGHLGQLVQFATSAAVVGHREIKERTYWKPVSAPSS